MLDFDRCIVKTMRKSSQLKGVSVVYFPEEFMTIETVINHLKHNLGELYDLFSWTPSASLHLTLLRCESSESLEVDRNLFIELLHDSMKRFRSQVLVAYKFTLSSDGVIRLNFNKINNRCFEGIDSKHLFHQLGMRYKSIAYPWITIAYLEEHALVDAFKYENILKSIIEEQVVNIQLHIDKLSIVEYSDTAFRQFKPIFSWRLENSAT